MQYGFPTCKGLIAHTSVSIPSPCPHSDLSNSHAAGNTNAGENSRGGRGDAPAAAAGVAGSSDTNSNAGGGGGKAGTSSFAGEKLVGFVMCV